MPKRTPRKVNGEHVLYHYLQKDLRERDVWLFQMLTARLMAELGIWLDPAIYQRFPILLPYAIRDPSCRRRGKDDTEEWGSPSSEGFFRDDNSLIKNLPSSLTISSPRKEIYDGARIGNGFTAAHVWRLTKDSNEEPDFTTRNALTYSFVPNLVWLPRQVGKLSDREGSFSQLYLQATASKIYRALDVTDELKPFVEEAWSLLPQPQGLPPQGLPDLEDLSFFSVSERFMGGRLAALRSVVAALEDVAAARPLPEKVVSARYGAGLSKLDRGAARNLHRQLQSYQRAVGT